MRANYFERLAEDERHYESLRRLEQNRQQRERERAAPRASGLPRQRHSWTPQLRRGLGMLLLRGGAALIPAAELRERCVALHLLEETP